MFRNGVEIMSNQSGDSIRYGQIDDVEVQNGGSKIMTYYIHQTLTSQTM